MAGWTNRGKYLILADFFRNTAEFTNYYVALATSATAPGPDTNLLSDLTQIAVGNGYTDGGFQLARNATDFDVLTEDDTGDKGIIQVKNVAWTASGGPIPASGSGARYAVMTTDEGTVANRQIICYWSLVSDRTVSDTQTLTLIDLELDLTE